MVSEPGLDDNVVAQVVQRGYTLRGRLLRPAKVMYLFRPSVAGPVLLDPEGFRQRLNAIRQKALENPAPETEQSYAPAQPQQQPSVPQQAAPATVQTTPPAQTTQPVQTAPNAPVPAHRQTVPTY